MAKLIFRYSTMFSGKSAEILQIYKNYERQNIKGICLIPSVDTASDGYIRSRFSDITIPAIKVKPDTNIIDLILEIKDLKFIIIDESNFLKKEQVDQLGTIVDYFDIDVMAYGLTTDFQGHLFEGAKRLIEIADKVEKIYVRSRCECGKTAIFNARFINGIFSNEGDNIVIDKNKKANTTSSVVYIPLCRKCYNKYRQK